MEFRLKNIYSNWLTEVGYRYNPNDEYCCKHIKRTVLKVASIILQVFDLKM